MSTRQTVLFVDWLSVDKGRWDQTWDRELLSDAGRQWVEDMKSEWNCTVDLSGHGMKPTRIPHGIRITLEKPRKSAPWLVADRPWEGPSLGWVTVLPDEGRYRCWYEISMPTQAKFVYQGARAMNLEGQVLAYAESQDGFHWTKPDLGIYAFEGGTATNIVAPFDSTNVFRDDSAPAEERYKCFDWDRLPQVSETQDSSTKYGLYGCVSADGYHWTRLSEPLLPYFHDTQNVGYYDATAQKYVGFFRGHHGGRAIGYSETADFRHWPPAQVFLYPGAEDSPAADYYNNCFTCYPGDPSLRLLFPSLFHHDSDLTAVRLAVSHDGKAFNWVSHEPILEVGQPGEWDCGHVYAGPNLVHLPDGRLALPYGGGKLTHQVGRRHAYKEGYPFNDEAGLAWAIWEDGRLAGIEAQEQGEFYTSSIAFGGCQIELNARTRGVGRIEVELHEPDGWLTRPLPGFTFAECIPFTGDQVWAPLQWKGKQDLVELAGKNLILRFRLSSAKVFGYRFD